MQTSRPLTYVEGHPLCCDVPMWLVGVQAGLAHYECKVCGRVECAIAAKPSDALPPEHAA